MEVKMGDRIIERFLSATNNLHDAVVQFQQHVDELQDFSCRLRTMTEHLQKTGGGLDDPSVLRLPKSVRPDRQDVSNVEGQISNAVDTLRREAAAS